MSSRSTEDQITNSGPTLELSGTRTSSIETTLRSTAKLRNNYIGEGLSYNKMYTILFVILYLNIRSMVYKHVLYLGGLDFNAGKTGFIPSE